MSGEIERQTDRQIDRQTDRQTDRETDRETDKETHAAEARLHIGWRYEERRDCQRGTPETY
jgi:hypothetical protein